MFDARRFSESSPLLGHSPRGGDRVWVGSRKTSSRPDGRWFAEANTRTFGFFGYVFFTRALSIMRAAPVSLWSSLRFTLSFGYVLHELLYPFGSFISFLIPGTVISGGECKDPGSY